jgi:phospholipase C
MALRLVRICALFAVALLGAIAVAPAVSAPAGEEPPAARFPTATPIKHLVVIYQENASFDRYFATYPVALNPPGEPPFHARPGTPAVNGLTETLRHHNPNLAQPFRFARRQAFTCDMNHDYTSEQKSYNAGLVNAFVESTEGRPFNPRQTCPQDDEGRYIAVMGHFDGNTVTALWHYAQYFALSDNHFATMFGESTRGALNLVAGDVYGVLCGPRGVVTAVGGPATEGAVPECGGPADSTDTPAPTNGTLATLVDDADPYWDICSTRESFALPVIALSGRTIGDLLSDAGITWGWFQDGFALGPNGECYPTSHGLEAFDRVAGVDPAEDTLTLQDYVPHHQPFQYFASTANPRHLPPGSVAAVGRDDQANHQYDLAWFWRAAEAGNLPAVSFLKARQSQDGHPGTSNPLDEQVFLVETINRLQRLPEWESMAVIIAWDDSDGWYDHVMPPIVNHSATELDHGCGTRTMGPPARCGYGPRLPLLVISPWARENYVSHALSDQTSILRFIEDNWLGGQRISDISFDSFAGSLLDLFDFSRPKLRRLILDPETGLIVQEP